VYDQYIEHLVETQYPKAKLLQQIPGVGALTSLAFILTLDDPGDATKPSETPEANRSMWFASSFGPPVELHPPMR